MKLCLKAWPTKGSILLLPEFNPLKLFHRFKSYKNIWDRGTLRYIFFTTIG